MAEVLNIGGQEFKKRHPLGVWGLSLITLGVYYFVWYYKVNDEARRYLGDEKIKPGIALLAVLLGWILLFIPPLVSIYNTGTRTLRMQEKAGVVNAISPVLTLALAFFGNFLIIGGFHVPYLQENLNKVWRRYEPQVPSEGVVAPSVAPPGTLPPGGGFSG